MKNFTLTGWLFLLFTLPMVAQESVVDRTLPEFNFSEAVFAGEMHWLASDYLAGRRTGSVGNEIAAEYIASQLRAFGYTPINDGSFFQDVPLMSVRGPKAGNLLAGKYNFNSGDNLLIMRGPAAQANAEVVFANYGWVDAETGHDDYADLDVKGKVVITRAGIPSDASQRGVFQGVSKKAEFAAAAGAVGIFEVYTLPFPWSNFTRYFGGDRMSLDSGAESATIPYGFIKAEEGFLPELQKKKKGLKGSMASSGMQVTRMTSRNVGGIIEGTDPNLKDEYMLMTAHFDHVGVGAQGGGAYTPVDSIFNGARDNAFGTISLLAAARAFSEVKPRRSIIILAVTGEEMGLLGSQHYAENPLVPLESTVFNFNTDGGGYNDTTAISLIGSNRTGIDEQVEVASAAFGLTVIKDPAPEQNLYDRSDNVSFSAKGVPSLSFSPGMTEFDDTIMRYYHQVKDNPETINMPYLKKYCQAFTLAARLIANRDVRPYWKAGDKYEEAGKQLYGTR
ncbi:M28 family peptidase [Lewinella sp. 4G2]|uniref:M28 family peptidase n=1 Tax=Lewinella sp. 4G2 TaxID=1803372 RepID=UPI0007B4B60D|nr:M28 family peptidase [Lewinella sp. 4G2]OAV45497.1 peptidase M28 [Lewinella sp. 4G2]